MRIRIPTLLFIAALGGGCVSVHHPPREGAPAATLRFRIEHRKAPAAQLLMHLTVDGRSVKCEPRDPRFSELTVRVAPGTRRLDIGSEFWAVGPTRSEAFYASGAKACSNPGWYGPCFKTVHGIGYTRLASCFRKSRLHVQAGGTYVVEYRFDDHRRCTLRWQKLHSPAPDTNRPRDWE